MSLLEEYIEAYEYLKKEQKAYEKRVSRASLDLKLAEQEKFRYITSIDKEISKTKRSQTKCIQSFAGVCLFPTYVSYRSVRINHDEPIQACVTMSGSIVTKVSGKSSPGISITGAIAGAAIGGGVGAVVGGKTSRMRISSEVVDAQRAFLVISTPKKRISVEIDPSQQGAAERFISNIVNVLGSAASSMESAAEKIDELRLKQNNTSSFNSRIDEAKKRRIEVREDTESLDAAKRYVEMLKQKATPEEQAQIEEYHKKLERRETFSAVAILLVFLGVVGVIGYFIFCTLFL